MDDQMTAYDADKSAHRVWVPEFTTYVDDDGYAFDGGSVDRRENATILYLVGPDDIDRRVARRHLFRNENLIAVDMCAENIEMVRRAGGLGVNASIEDVLRWWPEDWPIAAVAADFCAGLNREALNFASALCKCRGVTKETVVAVNLQRGRDKNGEWWWGGEFIRRFGSATDKDRDYDLEHSLLRRGVDNVRKHRGFMWAYYAHTLAFERWIASRMSAKPTEVAVTLAGTDWSTEWGADCLGFRTYDSPAHKDVKFDSTVMRWRYPKNDPEDGSDGAKYIAALRARRTQVMQ